MRQELEFSAAQCSLQVQEMSVLRSRAIKRLKERVNILVLYQAVNGVAAGLLQSRRSSP